VYLAALERAAREPGLRFTPASVIDDRPTTFRFGGRPWRPTNYGGVYDGPVTARAALARSRNVAAVKVGELAGFGAIARLWAAASGGPTPPAYPSIVLGSFESTPLEVAAAYTVLANRGVRAPLHAVSRVTAGEQVIHRAEDRPQPVAAADSAFLVTSMLRSTFDTGTAAAARRNGFVHDAAGKTGTSNDLRDAWFAGFTPTLLTVVWVGMDDNSPLGLTGAEAALPIWTAFMRRALAERTLPGFLPPSRVTLVDVCPDTGLAATAACPRPIAEAFAAGTEPGARCPRH
jgi:penicillin-binding protein 1B